MADGLLLPEIWDGDGLQAGDGLRIHLFEAVSDRLHGGRVAGNRVFARVGVKKLCTAPPDFREFCLRYRSSKRKATIRTRREMRTK